MHISSISSYPTLPRQSARYPRAGLLGLACYGSAAALPHTAWLSECVSLDKKPIAITAIGLLNATPVAVTALYFLFVSRDWFMLNLGAVLLGFAALLVSLFCPESPKWHLINGRRKEAIDCLNYIGKANGRLHPIPETA